MNLTVIFVIAGQNGILVLKFTKTLQLLLLSKLTHLKLSVSTIMRPLDFLSCKKIEAQNCFEMFCQHSQEDRLPSVYLHSEECWERSGNVWTVLTSGRQPGEDEILPVVDQVVADYDHAPWNYCNGWHLHAWEQHTLGNDKKDYQELEQLRSKSQ